MNVLEWIRKALNWRDLEVEMRLYKSLYEQTSDSLRAEERMHDKWKDSYWRVSDQLRDCKHRLNQFAGYRPTGYKGTKNRLIGDLLKLFPHGFSVAPCGEIGEVVQATSYIHYLRPIQGNEGYLLVRPVDKDLVDTDNPAVVGVIRHGGKILATRIDDRMAALPDQGE